MNPPAKLAKKLATRLWRYERNRGIPCEYVPAFEDAARECLAATHTGMGCSMHWSNRAYHYYQSPAYLGEE